MSSLWYTNDLKTNNWYQRQSDWLIFYYKIFRARFVIFCVWSCVFVCSWWSSEIATVLWYTEITTTHKHINTTTQFVINNHSRSGHFAHKPLLNGNEWRNKCCRYWYSSTHVGWKWFRFVENSYSQVHSRQTTWQAYLELDSKWTFTTSYIHCQIFVSLLSRSYEGLVSILTWYLCFNCSPQWLRGSLIHLSSF